MVEAWKQRRFATSRRFERALNGVQRRKAKQTEWGNIAGGGEFVSKLFCPFVKIVQQT